MLFLKCFDDIINKRVPPIMSKVLHLNNNSNQNMPNNFVQKVPDETYKKTKRNSVFHKVDINAFNLATIPEFKKS